MITDDVIMRTIIDLPDPQLAELDELCKRKKISRAEAVRRAVDAMLTEQRIDKREASFGAWQPRGDSRTLVDSLRGEWEE
jgi:metal-responsive CopG/Arc/MetJ family transcriptional regulator